MNLNHTVLHLGVIAESNNGQIWIDRQIISYELLCSFVNPLPTTMSIHFCWSLYDQDILKTKIKSSKLAIYCRKWPKIVKNGQKIAKMAQKYQLLSKLFQNCLHFRWSLHDQDIMKIKIGQILSKWPDIVKNGQTIAKMAQKYPLLSKFF